MNYFVVNGKPRSGKDTFIDYCLAYLGQYGYKISTIDFIKEIALKCGWDGVKSSKNRKFLSDLKDLLTMWKDVPHRQTLKNIQYFHHFLEQFDATDRGVVFILSREPEDIERFKEELNAKTILITRDEIDNLENFNHADAEVFKFNYDITITNNKNKEDLKLTAFNFLKSLTLI